MARLQAGYKDLTDLELYQFSFRFHNWKQAKLGRSWDIQSEFKLTALKLSGHNTPSPSNLNATPLDNTAFKGQMRNAEEEWKAIWAYLAW